MVWDFDGRLGRSSRLGISIDSLSPQLAEYFGTKEGVLVSSVTDNSAAAKAGVKAGDVITSFNGSTINDPQDLRRRIQSLNDGDEFTVIVMRDRKPVTLKGKAEWPAAPPNLQDDPVAEKIRLERRLRSCPGRGPGAAPSAWTAGRPRW